MTQTPSAEREPSRRGWSVKFRKRSFPVDGRHKYHRSDLESLVDAGCTANEIAHLVRVSLDTVFRDIRVLNLRERHEGAKRNRYIAEARVLCENLIARHPGRSLHSIRHLESRAIAYLEVNDSDWLRAKRPRTYSRHQVTRQDATGTTGHVAALLAQVRWAIASLRDELNGRRCTLRALRDRMGLSVYLFERIRTDTRCAKLISEATGRHGKPSLGARSPSAMPLS